MRSLFRSLAQPLLLFLTIAISLLGAWFGSSIVFHTLKGHSWISVLVGILLLPITPLLLQIYTERKVRRVGWKRRMPVLIDRALKRSFIFNLILIAVLLVFLPQVTFTALSKRGDWMLGNAKGENIQWVRHTLHQTASELKSLHTAVHANLKKSVVEEPEVGDYWPWRGQGVHPIVANMPPDMEASITSVADYIARKETDPVLRIKALHDYVADRVRYDTEAFLQGEPYPPQDPETVFRTHKAICQGYADLVAALGSAMGEQILTISGKSRTPLSTIDGQGHAWNIVKIKEKWHLLDATWDSGSLNDSLSFVKKYRADYLMPPPEVLIYDHFPDDPNWQLLNSPLSLERFQQQPALEPKFFAEGLRLVSPARAQTDVRSLAEIEVNNPKHRWLLATYAPQGSSQQEKCGLALLGSSSTSGNRISCLLPDTGIYEVSLFISSTQFSQNYEYVGKFEFNRL